MSVDAGGRARLPGLVGGVLLLLAVVGGVYWLAADLLALPQADDPYYQLLSARPLADILAADPNGSRAYILWYKGLSLFAGDTAALTAANSLLLGSALAVLVFGYVWQRSSSFWAGLGAGAVIACSYQNLGTWPKVSHFAMAVVLAGLVLGGRARGTAAQLRILAAALLVAAVARPELMIGFGLALLISLAWPFVARDGDSLRRVLVASTAVAVAAVLLHVAVGLPTIGAAGRSGVALSQHFALNWVVWEGSPRDPWLEHEAIWRAVFGEARGPAAALWANPPAMLRHLCENLLRLMALPLAAGFVPATAPLAVVPVPLWQPPLAPGYLLGAAFLAASAAALASRTLLRLHGAMLAGEAAKLGCILVPAAMSCLFIYPRYHYMLGVTLVLVPLGAVVIGLRWGGRPWFAPAVAAFVTGLLVLAAASTVPA